MPYITPVERNGIEKGIQQGKHPEAAHMQLRQNTHRFFRLRASKPKPGLKPSCSNDMNRGWRTPWMQQH